MTSESDTPASGDDAPDSSAPGGSAAQSSTAQSSTAQSSAAQPSADRSFAPQSFAHHGRVEELFSITLLNMALKFVTLGVYHFWGKTRIRRYVWSQTSFAGERFEYTGRGVELLRGFAISLVLVAPLLFAWGYPQFAVPETGGGFLALWLLDSFGSLYLFFLLGLARYSARRYLLGHTRWRGIRFALSGSARSHGWKLLGYTFLVSLTGGLYTPFMRSRLTSNFLNHTWFGDRRFAYDGNGWHLWRRFWGFIGLLFLLVIVSGATAVVLMGGWMMAPPPGAPNTITFLAPVLLPILMFYVSWNVSWAWYRAGELRYFFAHTTLGPVGFSAEFGTWDFIMLRLGNGAAVTLSLGLAYPWAVVRTAQFLSRHVRLTGAIDLASIGQSPAEALAAGEGLAEALGVSAI